VSSSDSERWDRRYRDTLKYAGLQFVRPYLIEQTRYLPASGTALDAACGLGNNAGYLLQKGFKVVAVDVSGVGIHKTHTSLPGLLAVQADLACLEFPTKSFDVILNFYYLERRLFTAYRRWLKPGGLLIFETLMVEMRTLKPDIDPKFLLGEGELARAFADWDVLDYQEGWVETRDGKTSATARMTARLP